MSIRSSFILLLGLAAVVASPDSSRACDGARRPACGRSVWLAKWVEEVVVHPGDGVAIEAKIGLLPYATWNLHPNCAQPSAASLTLTFECEPDDGGAAIVIGPVNVPVGLPTATGVQSVLTGPGQTPELGGSFCFPIGAGTLPAGKNYICNVVGEYTVTFAGGLNGAGSGTISGKGDAQVCIVEPSPLDAMHPRLLMRRLNPGMDPGFLSCRKGDQGTVFYLLANNDDEESVILDFETWTSQVARRPTGGTAEDTFSISSDKKGTDNFPLRFFSDLAPNELVSTDDIMKKTDHRISSKIILGPGEVRMIQVVARSHGMCADGSCSEVLAKVTGTWTDGSPALGCAGTAFLVDDVPAKSPLCEYEITLAVSPNTDGRWTRPELDKDHMLRSHYDNIKKFGGATIATSGTGLNSPWPDSITDTIRVQDAASSLRCTMDGFRQATNFQRDRNKITVTNLPAADFQFAIPHLARGENGSNLKVAYDATADQITVKDAKKGKKLFEGSLAALIGNPPAGLSVDPVTSFQVAKTGPGSAPLLGAAPGYVGGLFDAAIDPPNEDVRVYDERTSQDLAWSASSSSAALIVVSPTGAAGDPITVDWDLSSLPTAPEIECGTVRVQNPAAINDPVDIPFAGRATQVLIEPKLLTVTLFEADLFADSKKAKDTVVVHGTLPVVDGMTLKGLGVQFEFGPEVFDFKLDKKGKSKAKNATFRLKPEKVGGVVQEGDAEFELRLKKGRFANMFKCYGVLPAAIPPGGQAVTFPIRMRFPAPDAGVFLKIVPVIVAGDEVQMSLSLDETP